MFPKKLVFPNLSTPKLLCLPSFTILFRQIVFSPWKELLGSPLFSDIVSQWDVLKYIWKKKKTCFREMPISSESSTSWCFALHQLLCSLVITISTIITNITIINIVTTIINIMINIIVILWIRRICLVASAVFVATSRFSSTTPHQFSGFSAPPSPPQHTGPLSDILLIILFWSGYTVGAVTAGRWNSEKRFYFGKDWDWSSQASKMRSLITTYHQNT